jgi:anti-sigma B factor antagonist
MMLADIRFSQRGAALVGHVRGELDLSNAEEIGASIIENTPSEATGVVLDLSEVEYLDSAGIYVLYGLLEHLRARGKTLILVVPDASPVSDALRLAGVESHTEAAPSVEEALQVMAGDR